MEEVACSKFAIEKNIHSEIICLVDSTSEISKYVSVFDLSLSLPVFFSLCNFEPPRLIGDSSVDSKGDKLVELNHYGAGQVCKTSLECWMCLLSN